MNELKAFIVIFILLSCVVALIRKISMPTLAEILIEFRPDNWRKDNK